MKKEYLIKNLKHWDLESYGKENKDLRYNSSSLLKHALNHGIKEGRTLKFDKNKNFLKHKHVDLAEYFNQLDNFFIIQPIFGLSNRLRTLASAYSICKELNKNLIINWIPDCHCDCKIEDLITNIDDLCVGVINNIDTNKLMKLGVTFQRNYNDNPIIDHTKKKIYVESNNILNNEHSNKHINDFCDLCKGNVDMIKNIMTLNNNSLDFYIFNYKLLYNQSVKRDLTTKISSVCTMSTENNLIELELLLMSLNCFNQNLNTYIICDNYINHEIEKNKTKFKNLHITLVNNLSCSKYSNISSDFQQDKTKRQTWIDFMLEKTTIMKIALQSNPNTIFLDSDKVFFDKLPLVGNEDVCLSIHDTNFNAHKQFGLFNGGCVYTNKLDFCDWWKDKTNELQEKTFMEQGPLTHIYETNFSYSVFNNGINLGYWRPLLQDDAKTAEMNLNNIYIDKTNNEIMYHDDKIISIHTHFFMNPDFPHIKNIMIPFNKMILNTFVLSKCHKIQNICNYIFDKQKELINHEGKQLYNKQNYISKQKFVFICDNGLTNRILTLINAIYISNVIHQMIYIYWPVNTTCGCSYYDLFEKHPQLILLTEYELKEIMTNEKIYHISTRSEKELNHSITINQFKNDYNFKKINESLDLNDFEQLIKNITSTAIFSTFYLFHTFIKKTDIEYIWNTIKVQSRLIKRVNKIVNEQHINDDVFGIHLRYTDATFIQNNLNIKSKIFDDMKKIIKTNKHQKFFIACDDNSVKLEFVNIFPDNIIYFTTAEFQDINSDDERKWGAKYELNNIIRTKESTYDGFIEWLLLNKTTFKYGTGSSTYSILCSLLQKRKQTLWFINAGKVEKSIDFKLM